MFLKSGIIGPVDFFSHFNLFLPPPPPVQPFAFEDYSGPIRSRIHQLPSTHNKRRLNGDPAVKLIGLRFNQREIDITH